MIRRVTIATLIFAFTTGVGPALADPTTVRSAGPLRQSIARITSITPIRETPVRQALRRVPSHPLPSGSQRRHAFAMIGAIGGLLAGGFIGAKIEGDNCRCDDPGLSGFVIGAPIGAIVGGLIGDKLGR